MYTRSDFEQVPETQYEALVVLNDEMIQAVGRLEQRLLRQGRKAGLDDEAVGEYVTGWFQVVVDDAERARYFLTDLQKEKAREKARLAKPAIQLRDWADLFHRPGERTVTIDRPARASRDGEFGYTDRTYHATPASEQRVLRLMDERTWPIRKAVPKGWQVASTR